MEKGEKRLFEQRKVKLSILFTPNFFTTTNLDPQTTDQRPDGPSYRATMSKTKNKSTEPVTFAKKNLCTLQPTNGRAKIAALPVFFPDTGIRNSATIFTAISIHSRSGRHYIGQHTQWGPSSPSYAWERYRFRKKENGKKKKLKQGDFRRKHRIFFFKQPRTTTSRARHPWKPKEKYSMKKWAGSMILRLKTLRRATDGPS